MCILLLIVSIMVNIQMNNKYKSLIHQISAMITRKHVLNYNSPHHVGSLLADKEYAEELYPTCKRSLYI